MPSLFCILELFFFFYVSPFYTDTSIELRTSLLPFWTSVASTDSLVHYQECLYQMLVRASNLDWLILLPHT